MDESAITIDCEDTARDEASFRVCTHTKPTSWLVDEASEAVKDTDKKPLVERLRRSPITGMD